MNADAVYDEARVCFEYQKGQNRGVLLTKTGLYQHDLISKRTFYLINHFLVKVGLILLLIFSAGAKDDLCLSCFTDYVGKRSDYVGSTSPHLLVVLHHT